MLLVQAERIIFGTDEIYLTAFRTRLCWIKNQSSIGTSTRCWRNSKHAAQTMGKSMSSGGTITQHLISGDLAFGEPFYCLEKSDYHPWVALIFSGVKNMSFISAFSKFGALGMLLALLLCRKIYRQRVENTEGCLSRKHVEDSTRGQAGQCI